MILHPAFALPLLLLGWLGFCLRRTALGGIVSILVAWQGLLALGAICVFHRDNPGEGAILLWLFAFFASVSVVILLALALRQYYGHQNMKWSENERVKN